MSDYTADDYLRLAARCENMADGAVTETGRARWVEHATALLQAAETERARAALCADLHPDSIGGKLLQSAGLWRDPTPQEREP